MKKALIALSGFLLGLFFISCTVVVNQPEGKNQKKNSTITGKAFYSNSNDSSSIKVYIEKYSDTGAGRSVLSFSNCAADGTYRFENLEEGVYTIYATSSDSTEKAICRSISVKQNQTVELPDMTLTATGSVSGKISVVDSPEQNLGFIVFIAGTSFMAATDSQGNFKISGVPANPDYQIIVSKGTYSFLWKSNVNVALLENTDIGEFKITSNVLPYGSTTISFDIPYELNGGTLPPGAPHTFSYDNVTNLVAPEKEGHLFMGYFFTENFTGPQVTELDNDYSIGQKIYAKWLWEQAYDIKNLTQSSVVELSGMITEADLNDLKNALIELYSSKPEITISLDFSKVRALPSSNLPEFNNCFNLIEITASSDLLKIYKDLFKDCTTIKKVIIKNGTASIKDSAFANCINIQSIVLPVSIISIGSSAFSGCSGLTSITIPQNVIEIKDNAFHGCKHLYEIYNLSSLNLTCGTQDYGGVAYYARVIHNSLDEPSIFYTTEDGLSFVVTDNDCFLFSYNNSQNSIILPTTILIGERTISKYTISDSAFEDSISLTDITIPDSVTSIGSYAFSGCSSLESIVLSDNLTKIGDYAFKGCHSLTSIIIPDKVSTIHKGLFQDCFVLQNVKLPNKVRKIYGNAFSNCLNLNNLIVSGVWDVYQGSSVVLQELDVDALEMSRKIAFFSKDYNAPSFEFRRH